MATTVETGWLKNKHGDKFAPKTLISQVQTSDGVSLEEKMQVDSDKVNAEIENLQEDVNEAKDAAGQAVTGLETHNIAPDSHQILFDDKVDKSGDTMEGKLVAQNNTAYTTKQVRNVFIVSSSASLPSGSNGDVCLVYTP